MLLGPSRHLGYQECQSGSQSRRGRGSGGSGWAQGGRGANNTRGKWRAECSCLLGAGCRSRTPESPRQSSQRSSDRCAQRPASSPYPFRRSSLFVSSAGWITLRGNQGTLFLAQPAPRASARALGVSFPFRWTARDEQLAKHRPRIYFSAFFTCPFVFVRCIL